MSDQLNNNFYPIQSPLVNKESLNIPKPCAQDWEGMLGDEVRRFCESCNKHVHDISAMPIPEVENLLLNALEEICIRYAADEDGNPLTVNPLLNPEQTEQPQNPTPVKPHSMTMGGNPGQPVPPQPPVKQPDTILGKLVAPPSNTPPQEPPAPAPAPVKPAYNIAGGLVARKPSR